MIEDVEHESEARRQRAELGLEADQAARRDHVVEPHAALAVRLHRLSCPPRLPSAVITAPWLESSTSTARISNGSCSDAVDLLGDDARPRDRDLVAFAAHVLEQHAEMQLAAAVDLELVRVVRLLDPQRDVGQRLAQQALADLPAREVLALAPANGEVLTSNVMPMVGSSTTSGGSASGCSGSQSVSEIAGCSMPANATMSPARRLLDLDAIEPEEAEHLHDPLLTHRRPRGRRPLRPMLRRTEPRLMRPMPIAPT